MKSAIRKHKLSSIVFNFFFSINKKKKRFPSFSELANFLIRKNVPRLNSLGLQL